jgi:hypothetical protein
MAKKRKRKNNLFIYDWAGNFMSFNPTKGFDTIEEASGFLSEYLTDKLGVKDEDLDIEMDEYQYLTKEVQGGFKCQTIKL